MIQLLVGENREIVDTENIENVSIKYALKDIKNYGRRNISYTKPIKVLKTSLTERIFKNLNDINVVDGFEISKFVKAELVENGITILKGTLQVVESYEDSYDVIVTSPQFNLFDEMGDFYIRDNDVSSNDISFSDSYYTFNFNRADIRTGLNSTIAAGDYGKGFQYTIIDRLDDISSTDDIRDDYIILPSIAAKEIWDAIFEKYGYTYTLSDDIATYLSHMYIPFNDDHNRYLSEWNYANWRLGDPSTSDFPYNVNNPYSPYQPVLFTTDGSTGYYGGNCFGRTLQEPTNFDDQLGLEVFYTDDQQYFDIFSTGSYTIDLNLMFSPAYEYDDSLFSNWDAKYTTNMDVYLNILRGGEIIYNKLEQFSDASLLSQDSTSYYTQTIEDLKLYRGDKVYVNVLRTEETDKTVNISAWVPEYTWVIKDPSTYINFTLNDSYFGSDTEWNLNNLLPVNYKQADFINDIFKIFNCYVDVDPDDPKHILINSYTEYFNSGTVKDWTDKVYTDGMSFKSIKNDFAKTTILKYTEDDDIYNQDFIVKMPLTFGAKSVENDSEISHNVNEIIINASPTVTKTVTLTY